MFSGLSLLRKQEKKVVEETEEKKQLQAYLQKYTSGVTHRQDLHTSRNAPQIKLLVKNTNVLSFRTYCEESFQLKYMQGTHSAFAAPTAETLGLALTRTYRWW
jgi:alkyl hydroperoxide reductase subunit AhpF